MTCYVTSVQPQKTRDHRVTRFEVFLRKPDDKMASVIATTVNAWMASRLERAKVQGTLLDLTVTDTKWGHEVTAIAVPEQVA